jgi:hypothetical protein
LPVTGWAIRAGSGSKARSLNSSGAAISMPGWYQRRGAAARCRSLWSPWRPCRCSFTTSQSPNYSHGWLRRDRNPGRG